MKAENLKRASELMDELIRLRDAEEQVNRRDIVSAKITVGLTGGNIGGPRSKTIHIPESEAQDWINGHIETRIENALSQLKLLGVDTSMLERKEDDQESSR